MSETQFTDPPGAPNPAGVAIARIGAVRRRRSVLGGAAAVMAVIAVVGGIGIANARDKAAPTPPATRTTPVDVVDDNMLHTTDGRKLRLPGVAANGDNLVYITTVPEGWVYVASSTRDGDDVPVTTRLLHRGGGIRSIPTEEIALSDDGTRIAWADLSKRTVSVARITAGGFKDVRTTPVPQQVSPHLWVGDRVELRKGCCGGDGQTTRYDMWDPARGRFVPNWSHEMLMWPMDADEDGAIYVAKEREADNCLVRLDPDQRHKEVGSWCDPTMWDGEFLLAGRWFPVYSETPGVVRFVDVKSTINSGVPRFMVGCAGLDLGRAEPVRDGSSSLVGESTLGGLTRCTITDDGRVTQERFDAATLPSDESLLVPRLGK